jgi:hypothetical protein
MQLTSKEQALLSQALDQYIGHVDFNQHPTQAMWNDLYDEVIDADIDDVGEDYDPAEDYDLSWDAAAIKSFAENLATDGDDDDDINDSVNYIVADLSDNMAWKLYHALNTRFDAEFEAAAQSREIEPECDMPEFNPSDDNPQNRFGRFSAKVEPQIEPEQTKKIS